MSINVEHFKNLFLELQKNGGDSNNLKQKIEMKISGDNADIAELERNRNLILKLDQREEFFQKKIAEALVRIEKDEFGLCLDCGDEITEKRLLARPTACLCINCKEENERGESHILYSKKTKTNGRSFVTKGEDITKAYKEVARFEAS